MSRFQFLLMLSAWLHTFDSLGAPSQTQLENLTRGTTVTWFSNDKSTFQEARAKEELVLLNKTGVRHLRFGLSHLSFFSPENPSEPLQGTFDELSKGITFANREGFAVIITPFHFGPNWSRLSPPAPNTPAADQMIRLWEALAKHLSGTDPNLVFLEIASEPTHRTPGAWFELQLRCHQAIRAAAPKHVIIATAATHMTGNRWDTITSLTSLKAPIPDENTVYNFHYRSPFVFTYQGRSISSQSYLSQLTQVPYPSDSKNVAPLITSATDPAAKNRLLTYAEEKWDRNRIREDISLAAKWAQKHNVRLTCNEFGVFREGPVPAHRFDYLKDVREVLEEFGIGWTVWGNNCGIFKHEFRPYFLDLQAAEALGLLAK